MLPQARSRRTPRTLIECPFDPGPALLLSLLSSFAAAQAVRAVPPGARAVTVMVCDEADGCRDGFEAMSDHCAALGLPLLDFDAVSAAGPGGGDARAALDEALLAVGIGPGSSATGRPGTRIAWEAARSAMRTTPLTLPPDEPFRIWLGLGAARLAGGDVSGADEAFAAAASASNGRVYDLPPLPAEALSRYLDAAAAPASTGTLIVEADHDGGQVFVDGRQSLTSPIELPAGWHRVTVERTGRRTAWVGEVVAVAGRTLTVRASIDADDAPAALEVAVAGAIRGTAPPADVPERLAAWARTQGLAEVRFVRLTHAHDDRSPPEERITGHGWDWDVDATWLDVSRARLSPDGPGPATLRAAGSPQRFSMGLTLGYTRLQQSLVTGPDPHDQLTAELVGIVTLRPSLALDARLGLWHSAQPYYLYADWLDHDVVPVSAGARWSFGDTGVYVGAHALAVVPFALGGDLFAGWLWRPSPRWRVGLEARGGVTDHGPLGGGGVTVGFEG